MLIDLHSVLVTLMTLIGVFGEVPGDVTFAIATLEQLPMLR